MASEQTTGDRQREALVSLTHGDPARRTMAIHELGKLNDPSVAPFVLERFRDADLHVRMAAIEWGMEWSAAAATPVIASMVCGAASLDRETVFSALEGLRSPPLLILTLVVRHPDQWVRERAIRVLAKAGVFRPPPDGDWLLALFLKDHDPFIRESAARAMKDYGGLSSNVIPPLAELAGDTPEIWAMAVEALGHTRHPDALSPLGRAVKDADPRVRRSAVRALGELAMPEGAALLTGVIEDANPLVRHEVMGVLGMFHHPAVLPMLKEALKRPEMVSTALQVLGDEALGSGRFPLVLPLLSHPQVAIRREAAQVLKFGADASCMPALKKALSDADGQVRQNAREALEGLGQGMSDVLHRPK